MTPREIWRQSAVINPKVQTRHLCFAYAPAFTSCGGYTSLPFYTVPKSHVYSLTLPAIQCRVLPDFQISQPHRDQHDSVEHAGGENARETL